MHFSRPSGQRLSWCRPWKRGAVGIFSNGYSSVTTFLNMVRKVTPNPATGSQNCCLRLATDGLPFGRRGGGHRRFGLLTGHRRDGVPAREGVERGLLVLRLGL